jgi:FixJ family two-component response regulator
MQGSVLVLDDDDDFREALGDLIGLLGRHYVGARSVAELDAQRQAVLECDAAILDVNLGPGMPSGLDAYRWLQREQFPGAILFLTGHARSHPQVAAARAVGAQVIEKPIPAAELQALLEHGGR